MSYPHVTQFETLDAGRARARSVFPHTRSRPEPTRQLVRLFALHRPRPAGCAAARR